MPQNTGIPIIVQGNSYNLVIPLQIYIVDDGEMVLQDFTPDAADVVKISLKCKERTYNFAPTITGNEATIALTGHEVVGIYAIEVVIVQADGTQYRSLRTDQFVIIDASDDLTEDEIIEGLEENVIYINPQLFIAGERGRSIVDVSLTSTAGLVDTYTITYSDGTTSTFNVTNGSGQLVIVNDLTTGGVDKALSAEMGKVLKGEVDGINGVEQTPLTLLADTYGYYNTSGAYVTTQSTSYRNTGKVAIPAGCNKVVAYTQATTSMCAIAFFDANDDFIAASSVIGMSSSQMYVYEADIPLNAASVAVCLRIVGGELNYFYAYASSTRTSLLTLSERIDNVGKEEACANVYITTEKQYVNTDGAIQRTTGDKYKTTDMVEIPTWATRIRCRTASTSTMCAIAFYDEDGTFMANDKVVVSSALTTSIQTFDVAVPSGAKYIMCSTIYATTFRCIMYSDAWKDNWMSQLLILGDSITYSTDITTSNGKTTEYKLHETTPPDKWVAQLIQAADVYETRCYAMTGGHWCDNANATAFQNLSEQISVAVADKDNPNDVFMSDEFEPTAIILALGTNDAGGIVDGDYTLGDVATTMAKTYANLDMTIFSDAVRKCIEDIRTTWPAPDIYVSLPLYRHSDSIMPYVEQVRDVLRAIAPRYGCRIIEAGALSGIYRYNQSDLLRDGLHPNQAGQDKLAEVIIGHVSNSLGSVHTVVDNLTSTSTTDALSANQGRVLKGFVDGKADKRTLVDNSSTSGSVELSVNGYHNLGVRTSVTVTLPSSASRTDEFLFTFEVGSSWGSVALPSGVVMADGFDWSEAAAGVVFEVSIRDGRCAYLCVTPNS